ncbi:MAG: tetratricopeptide repeat protein [Bacteroidales bacterium]|jgi:tetratricopeptide (TPR) repeat protein|nr:tetratricopeptide repeat protein [Bacteroidales bacterium]MCI2121111.1 tetratricopeptide repeat protein [Bacteroidales bacterium]MCI2144926.1 tetratricopeptide repeat protein [Bacteroidales bacterium]
MKKILLVVSVLFLAVGFTFAQDLESATNLYNEAATALNEGKDSLALATFQDAQTKAEALGDEGAQIVANCKGIIPKIYLSMAKTAAKNNDNNTAISLLKTSSEMAKANADSVTFEEADDLIPQLMLQNANILLNKHQFSEAADLYRQVCEIQPGNGVAMLRYGMAENASGDIDGAIETLKKAQELGEEANAKKQLSNIYLKKSAEALKTKDFSGALESAQQSVSYLDNATAEKIIGMTALATKKYDTAIAGFESYIAQSPDAKDLNQIYYQVGSAYEANGNTGKACAYYKKIVNDKRFGQAAQYKVKTTLKCK